MAETTDDLTLLCRHCKQVLNQAHVGMAWVDETGAETCPAGGDRHYPQYDDDDLMVVLEELWKVIPDYCLPLVLATAPDGTKCVALGVDHGDYPNSKLVEPHEFKDKETLALLRSIKGQYFQKHWKGYTSELDGLPVYWWEHLPTRPKFNMV